MSLNDARLSRDLGADWLDRLELMLSVEEVTGVDIRTSYSEIRAARWILGVCCSRSHN